MIERPPKHWRCQQAEESFSAIRATAEKILSTGSTRRHRRFGSCHLTKARKASRLSVRFASASKAASQGCGTDPMGRVYSRSWHGLWTSLLLRTLHFNLEQAGIVSSL
jgi:hypothetical protein